MYQSISKTAFLSIFLCAILTSFGMELCTDTVPLEMRKLYNENKYNNVEVIRGIAHGNTHLLERTRQNKDLFYLLRMPDTGFDKPYLVSVCPYAIVKLTQDEDTLVFLKKTNWPNNDRPAGILRVPTPFLLGCIENNLKSIKDELAKQNELEQLDIETLRDCLFVAIENNRYSHDTNCITTLFTHSYLYKRVIKHNFDEFIDFANRPIETSKYVTINYAAQELEKIKEEKRSGSQKNLKINSSDQTTPAQSTSKPQKSYLSRAVDAVTPRTKFTRKKTNSSNRFDKRATESTEKDQEEKK